MPALHAQAGPASSGRTGIAHRAALLLGSSAMLLLVSGCNAPPVQPYLPGDPGPLPSQSPIYPDSGDPGPLPSQSPVPSPTQSSAPLPPPAPPPPTQDDALSAFQAQCEDGVEEWKAAQVDYPATMSLDVGEAETYNAAVDARSAPLPAEEVIEADSGAANSESVQVRCVIAARLRAVGETLAVEDPAEDSGGWIAQEFTPTGVLEWAWTVTADKPADAELRLDLKPAIAIGSSGTATQYASQSTTSFTTDVDVSGNWLSHVAFWFDNNWGYVTAIAITLGGAATAVFLWWLNLRSKAKGARQGEAPKPQTPDPAAR